jgi:hypothetical protein
MHYLWARAPSWPRAPRPVSYLPPRPLRCHKIANGQAQAHVAMWMTSTAPALCRCGYLRRPARPALHLPSDPQPACGTSARVLQSPPSTSPQAGRERPLIALRQHSESVSVVRRHQARRRPESAEVVVPILARQASRRGRRIAVPYLHPRKDAAQCSGRSLCGLQIPHTS